MFVLLVNLRCRPKPISFGQIIVGVYEMKFFYAHSREIVNYTFKCIIILNF